MQCNQLFSDGRLDDTRQQFGCRQLVRYIAQNAEAECAGSIAVSSPYKTQQTLSIVMNRYQILERYDDDSLSVSQSVCACMTLSLCVAVCPTNCLSV